MTQWDATVVVVVTAAIMVVPKNYCILFTFCQEMYSTLKNEVYKLTIGLLSGVNIRDAVSSDSYSVMQKTILV